MKKLILYLIRKRLRVKKYQYFRFSNQKKDSVYFFHPTGLMKIEKGEIKYSKVSFNWLLDSECEAVPLSGVEIWIGDGEWRKK